jgi:hypothetical protein
MLRGASGRRDGRAHTPARAGRGAFQPPAWRSNGRVLWVGRICDVKRPDRLLEVAEACPETPFDLVGPAGDDAFTRAVLQRARQMPNVALHGRASRDQMESSYRQATCSAPPTARGSPTRFSRRGATGSRSSPPWIRTA